jgi:predicted ester cyclase
LRVPGTPRYRFLPEDWTVPEPIRDKDGARRYVQAWFTAFPDMSLKLGVRVIDGNTVAAELEFTGRTPGRPPWAA